MGITSLLNPL